MIEPAPATPVDSQALHARIAETSLARFAVATQGATALGGLAFVLHLGFHPDRPWTLQLAIALATLYTASLHLLARRRRVPSRLAPLFGSSMMWVAVAVTAWGFHVTRSTEYTAAVALFTVASGVLHIRRWAVLLDLLVTVAVWTPIGFATVGDGFAIQLFVLVSLALIALLLHEIIVHYLTGLEALRLRDREREREREELRAQLWHAQKLESLGTLAGGVAHDMNNVLAAVIGMAELIREDTRGATRDDVDQLIATAERGAELTRNLLGFARRGSYHRVPVDVGRLIDGVTKVLARTLPRTLTIEVEAQGATTTVGDVARLSHALMNLCLNAADAMAGRGVLRLQATDVVLPAAEARALDVEPGPYVAIAVIDSGAGMTDEVKARLFEPFFTTKPAGAGSGLGLAMVHGTARGHGGSVRVESALGRGTTVTLYLPGSEPTVVIEPAEAPTERSKGLGTILVVDDEAVVRAATSRCLEQAGFGVLVAGDGAEALAVFAAHQDLIALVLLDMAMPVMGGAECFDRLRQLAPAARVVLTSGYACEVEAQGVLDRGALGFLEKPFRQRELIERVTAALLRKPR